MEEKKNDKDRDVPIIMTKFGGPNSRIIKVVILIICFIVGIVSGMSLGNVWWVNEGVTKIVSFLNKQAYKQVRKATRDEIIENGCGCDECCSDEKVVSKKKV